MWRNRTGIRGAGVKTRHGLLLSFIAILLLVNLWRWWPRPMVNNSKDVGILPTNIVTDDIKLLKYITPDKKDIALKRNLFSSVIKHTKTRKKSARKKGKPDSQAVKSDQRYSSLNAFKLEGMLAAEGRVQAFLSKQDQIYMVYKGERFASKIIAEEISHDGILLKDMSNGMTKWMPINDE